MTEAELAKALGEGWSSMVSKNPRRAPCVTFTSPEGVMLDVYLGPEKTVARVRTRLRNLGTVIAPTYTIDDVYTEVVLAVDGVEGLVQRVRDVLARMKERTMVQAHCNDLALAAIPAVDG